MRQRSAPRRGQKGKGVKGTEARFAFAVQTLMNDMASEGWEFQRAETLPSDERQGLKGTQTIYRDLLVFRRLRPEEEAPVNPVPVVSDQAEEHVQPDADDMPDMANENPDHEMADHADDVEEPVYETEAQTDDLAAPDPHADPDHEQR